MIQTTVKVARGYWDADRAILRVEAPEWEMPAWSRAPAWRRRPYLLSAKEGRHPDTAMDAAIERAIRRVASDTAHICQGGSLTIDQIEE